MINLIERYKFVIFDNKQWAQWSWNQTKKTRVRTCAHQQHPITTSTSKTPSFRSNSLIPLNSVILKHKKISKLEIMTTNTNRLHNHWKGGSGFNSKNRKNSLKSCRLNSNNKMNSLSNKTYLWSNKTNNSQPNSNKPSWVIS